MPVDLPAARPYRVTCAGQAHPALVRHVRSSSLSSSHPSSGWSRCRSSPMTRSSSRTVDIPAARPHVRQLQASIFQFIPYPRYFLNSVIVAVVTTVASTTVSVLARLRLFAVSLSRPLGDRFPDPRHSDVPARHRHHSQLYLVFAKLGLIDSVLGAVRSLYVAFTIPFCTWMPAGLFRQHPARDRRGIDHRRLFAPADPR